LTPVIAARPGKAGDKTKTDRVFGNAEDDGDRRGCRLGRKRRSGASVCCDHGYPSANQFGGQRRQQVKFTFRPPVFDRHVLALDIAAVFQALAKCAQLVRYCMGRPGVEISDHGHRQLLRARCQGPRSCCAAEQRDEFASFHRITPRQARRT
jgi:hypothetical protein